MEQLWKGAYIGAKCPYEDCSGFVGAHDPGGSEPHQLRCSAEPEHMTEISADRYSQLQLEARSRAEA
jgi:hypothetical protein